MHRPETCLSLYWVSNVRKTMVSKDQMVPGLMEWRVLWRRLVLIMWLPTQMSLTLAWTRKEENPMHSAPVINGK